MLYLCVFDQVQNKPTLFYISKKICLKKWFLVKTYSSPVRLYFNAHYKNCIRTRTRRGLLAYLCLSFQYICTCTKLTINPRCKKLIISARFSAEFVFLFFAHPVIRLMFNISNAMCIFSEAYMIISLSVCMSLLG